MVAGAERLKLEIGYNPTRFMQMVGELGASRPHASCFAAVTRRTDSPPCERTIDSTSVWRPSCSYPWYGEMFSEQELGTARRRLVEHGFDVARFLTTAGCHPA